MMKSPFLVLKKDCSEAVQWVSDHLNQNGLQVVQTFDLHTTRFDHSSCTCPHHGTEECDCQIVVLLVYEKNGFPPASIVAHGHDSQTWFALVDSPQQSIHSGLDADIQDALAPHILALKLDDLANAS
jgi:hypothetical protein